MNYNRVILAGNLTRDPELKYLPNNTALCEFGLAINRKWRDANGNAKEDVCFVDCAVFGKQAETFNQYMSKGRPVLVEGRLKFDSWEGKDGSKRSKLSVTVESFQFGGDKRGENGTKPDTQPQSAAQSHRYEGDGSAGSEMPPPPTGDDIPF